MDFMDFKEFSRARKRSRHVTFWLIAAGMLAVLGLCVWMYWKTAFTP